MTTRLSALLLMAVLCIINLARAQDFTPTSAAAGRHFETGKSLPWRSLPASGGFAGSSVSKAQPGPWTMQLVGRLAKHSELNRRQLQIILDAISLSSSEFFAASANTPALKVKADNAVQGLRQRALAAFPKNEVASLFSYVGVQQTDQEIIRKYYDLSSLPLKGRRTEFRRASSSEKCALWRTHLALVIVRNPGLNEWQKEIILAAMLLLTPERYDVPSSSPDWKRRVREPSRLLEQQITLAFSSEDAAKIFTTLGDNTAAAQNGPTPSGSPSLKTINYQPVSDSGPYQQWIHSRFSSQDIEFEQHSSCGCSTVWDFCWGVKYCTPSSCSSTQDGCGLGWSYPCNGVCR